MSQPRIRDLGYGPGYYTPGPKNSILDIPGLQVGQNQVHDDEKQIHVGVTVVFPRGTVETRLKPCYAGIHVLNGAGELTGRSFIDEWGYTNSPIAFTDSMSCGSVYQTLTQYGWEISRSLGESADVGYSHFGFAVVGETWGGTITDIHDGKSTLSQEQVRVALKDAETRQEVLEGSCGGGAGMLCQGFKAGTGTSSRLVPGKESENGEIKNYTVAALVQTNYGQKQTLQIGGVPVGRLLLKDEVMREQGDRHPFGNEGSILIMLVTDAPLLSHQLKRLAQRATIGHAAVGGYGTAHNTSGDIFIALSTSSDSVPEVVHRCEWNRPTATQGAKMGGNISKPPELENEPSGSRYRRFVETQSVKTVCHSTIDALFAASSEVTEEAILNALCAGKSVKAVDGTVWEGLPHTKVKEYLDKYRLVF